MRSLLRRADAACKGTRRLLVLITGVELGIVGLRCPMPVQGSVAASPLSVRDRDESRLVEQVLVHGEPAEKRSWALRRIAGCGATGGRVVASILRDHRADTRCEPTLDILVEASSGLVDRTIFTTALELATDRAAGAGARVQAIRLLFLQLHPGSHQPFAAFANAEQPLDPEGAHYPVVGEPLPHDFESTIEAQLRLVESDAHAPGSVRNAARLVSAAAAAHSRLRRLCPPATSSATYRARLDAEDVARVP